MANAILLSLLYAFMVFAIMCIVGIPTAFLMAHFHEKAQNLINKIITKLKGNKANEK